MFWKTSKRTIDLSDPIVMGILNVTSDSFSDGGRFTSVESAIRQAESMIADGAAVIDIGGESTRPGSERVDESVEIERVVPAIEGIAARFDVPISIDSSKSAVAEAAINAGAEIVNDISGLRFDERIAEVAARRGAGLVLMHSRGEFEMMHSQSPANDIIADVKADFHRAIGTAESHGVERERIVLDVGVGFGKTLEQNLELIAKLDKIGGTFSDLPLLVGVSRKSFIGKILDGAPPEDRLSGSLAAALIGVLNGAKIIRVHDVRESVQAIKIAVAIVAQS